MCGASRIDRPFLYFPALVESLGSGTVNTSMAWCVSACPNVSGITVPPKCMCLDQNEPVDCWTGPNATCWLAYPTSNAYYSISRCIPSIITTANYTEVLNAVVGDYTNIIVGGIRDIASKWWVFLVSAGIAIVLCFIWMLFLRYCATCMVYTLIALLLCAMTAISAYVIWYGVGEYRSTAALGGSLTSPIIILVIGGVVGLADLIFMLILCGICSRIHLAAEIVKVASRTVGSMPTIIFSPILTVFLMLIFTAFTLIVGICMFSSQGLALDGGHRSVNWSWTLRYLLIYIVFFFFWGNFFLYGMTQTIIAGAVHMHYWTKRDASGKQINPPRAPLCSSMCRTLRYHMGGVAFGSLIIALVATIRAIVLYLQKKMKGTKNKPLQYCLACVSCCLACLQKIVQYISKNGYIMMALNGTGFCKSAYDGFNLIMRNIIRAGTIATIGEFLIFVGKLLVALLAALSAMVIIRPDFVHAQSYLKPDDTIYWWIPVLCIFVMSYFIASALFTTYGFTIDTLFLDFLEDEERTGSGATYTYAPPELLECMSHSKNAARAKGKTSGSDGDSQVRPYSKAEAGAPQGPVKAQAF
eukprot:GAFH01001006.1.p1 GENE.GAFH01001006.1~~GAFH01001006.1.p1  ORF type:complete len:670 (-),score=141.13 GAFH01001006.1:147-1898(-)